MTRDRAKELLPIIAAFAEGKEIQRFDHSDKTWKNCFYPDEISFETDTKLRIKPEPREFWLGMYNQEGLQGGVYLTKEEAIKNSICNSVIHVKEVID